MKLTNKQALAIVQAEPFLIGRIVLDDDGIVLDECWVASNIMYEWRDLPRTRLCDVYADDFRSSVATYLCHVQLEQEALPRYGNFLDIVEMELLYVELLPVEEETQP